VISENSPSKVAAADQPLVHFISAAAVVSAESCACAAPLTMKLAPGNARNVCNALAPLLPPLFDDRSDIANELLQAHHTVVALLAGQIAEEILIGEVLPGISHDLDEARSIAG
jgi:hypothetical protein